MCFRFGSCFRSGSGQDYGWSTPKTTHRGGGGGLSRSHWGILADHGYYGGADHKPGPQVYHQQHAVDDEAGRNADAGLRKNHFDGACGPSGYYEQDKAGDDAPKQPALRSGKVGDDDDDAGHNYT